MQQVLIEGSWQDSHSRGVYQSVNPSTGASLAAEFPVSEWSDCDRALSAAAEASRELQATSPATIASFLRNYAERIEGDGEKLCEMAAEESALPVRPRLLEVELPRTCNQLRAAAAAAEDRSWRLIEFDEDAGLASGLGPIGPVLVLGPNNFPFAFNAVSGGDFAAAIAAGNPVIAKSHPDHPNTTKTLAELATQAVKHSGAPRGIFQVLWGVEDKTGLRMAGDPRLGAVAFTGSRRGGLALKQAADEVGKPFFAEMSSVNPVFVLPSALSRRGGEIADEYASSVLLGAGQFCTCPNLAIIPAGDAAEALIDQVAATFNERTPGTLLSPRVAEDLDRTASELDGAGAKRVCGGKRSDASAATFENTLMRVDGQTFLSHPQALQTEGFGPLSLVVTIDGDDQWLQVCRAIEGSLTGSVYFDAPADTNLCSELTHAMRWMAGRVMHNKMPTGVAVSPAMNHGGPFPASTHPGHTAVGLPPAMRRFAKLDCYDNVASDFWPAWLRDAKSAAKG